MATGDDKKKYEDVKKLTDEMNRLFGLMKKSKNVLISDREIKNLNDYNAGFEKYFEQLKLVQNEWREHNEGVLGTFKTIKNITKEIGAGISPLKQAQGIYKGIQSIAQQLEDDALHVNRMSEKEIVSKKKELEIFKSRLTTQADELKEKEKSLAVGEKLSEEEQAVLNAVEARFPMEEELIDILNERLKQERQIKTTVGITGQLLKGASGILTKMGFDADIFKEALADAETEAGKSKNSFKAMWAGISSMGKGILTQMRDPLFVTSLVIAGIVKTFQIIKDLVLDFNDKAVELGRNFGIAGQTAVDLEKNIRSAAIRTGELRDNIREAYMELNQAAGTFGKITDENLDAYIKLTRYAGYSKDAIQAMYKISVLQGKTLDQVVESEFNRSKELANQSGLAINQKEIMESIGKLSAATQLSLKQYGPNLSDAVFQAKRLGVDMQTLQSMASSLLDFESSISSEMEAELLTGKQLNFEKARLLALNNDLAGVAEEMLKQDITAEGFANMNYLQQEAIAKSMGLQRDAMAEMLIKGELLRSGEIEANETTYQQMKDNMKIQERMQKAWGSIKEAFQKAIEPVIEKINAFFSNESNYKGFVDGLKSAAEGIGGILKAIHDLGLGKILGSAVVAAGTVGLVSLARMAIGSTPFTPMWVRFSKMGMGMGGIGAMRTMGIAALGAGGIYASTKAGSALKEAGHETAGSAMSIGGSMASGGLAGFAIGGPWGAAIGAAIGGGYALMQESNQKNGEKLDKIAKNTEQAEKSLGELNYTVKKGKEIKLSGNAVGTAVGMDDYYLGGTSMPGH